MYKITRLDPLHIEVNLRKTKLLLFGAYRSDHPELGVSIFDYFSQVSLALDTYSRYDKFLLVGDFNTVTLLLYQGFKTV